MKLSLTAFAALLPFSALTKAWIFTVPTQQFDGDNNFSCTPIYVAKGEIIDFQVGILESCVIRVYNDAQCDVQIGISSRDWTHTLGRPMFAFDIQDC
ncbi:hypothetical protein K469DRAFT_569728 [Zopfia rhizophila CBS 207.26]|uniref:Uncharacterized protein n=1 Tax=Zopfia rhizophila CBS 207.26 TaxID=1314779 RepID=A0A6A6E8V9_9PEZI|nr:hypothetical protein K469DRAFT_569728 [Zopfia rhizophila CBS 207.26]